MGFCKTLSEEDSFMFFLIFFTLDISNFHIAYFFMKSVQTGQASEPFSCLASIWIRLSFLFRGIL